MQSEIQVKAGDEELKGRYANAMQLTHTKEEFFLDFFIISPPLGQLVTKVVTSPGHMKRIAEAIKQNIEIYEKNYGKIQEAEAPQSEIGFRS